jgi:hypothetical protein
VAPAILSERYRLISTVTTITPQTAPSRLLLQLQFRVLVCPETFSGGSYEAIPLEVNAYTLGGRFESDPRRMFSVEDEVGRWASEGKL